MRFLFWGLVSALVGFSSLTLAAKDSCDDKLKHLNHTQVNAPGEYDEGDKILEEGQLVTRIAHDLGLATPRHQVNIVPSDQLDTMAASSGTHPAPHALEGAELLRSLSSVSGVLEFVTGCTQCRSYHSSSTGDIERKGGIFPHVAGHNDYSATSKYINQRLSDTPLAGYQLAQALSQAYINHDHDEVALFYQYLKSIEHLQDYKYGAFEAPAKFAPAAESQLKPATPQSLWSTVQNAGSSFFDSLKPKSALKDAPTVSWKKTYSVLQAFSENLPIQSPDWQKTLIKLFENSRRGQPGIFQTKIFNEGWATLMMYIIPRYFPNVTSKELVRYAQLLSGVVHPSFENPYWVGLSGWMNVYKQFVQRPDIQALTPWEQDQKFIAWGRGLYESKNDSAMAMATFDERWIEKNNFFLYRETTKDELEADRPQESQKYIVLSRNWQRVRNFIIRQYVDNKLRAIPPISFLNPSTSFGYITLTQEDMEEGLPLNIFSAAKTCFVIAQLFKAPVRFTGLFRSNAETLETEKATFTVQVNGSVNFEGSHKAEANFSDVLTKAIDDYKDDVLGSFHSGVSELMSKQWGQMAAQVGDFNAAEASRIIEFAPHTAGAIREYLQLVEFRLRKSLLDSLNGTKPLTYGSRGVSLQILPEVPSFEFERGYFEAVAAQKPVGPVDYRGHVTDYNFDVDDNGTKIGVGAVLPGDKFGKKETGEGEGQGQGPKQPAKGAGDGKDKSGSGKGDPDESPGDGDAQGDPQKGFGDGSGNGGDVKIPLKLYGELLSEVLELPNLRRTNGDNEEFKTVRMGSVRKSAGTIVWDRTMMAAIEKARALRRAQGLPSDSSVSVTDLINEGLPLLERSDYVVVARRQQPRPDFDAVVVFNIDLTGSMDFKSGVMDVKRIELAKNLIYNAKALLNASYKRVHVVYVGFDTEARELTEEEVFSKFFNGGTNYTSTIKRDEEILERYDSTKFNKYVITIGDGETSEADARSYTAGLGQMRDELQYAGLALINEKGEEGAPNLIAAHRSLQSEWEWLGVSFFRKTGDMLQGLKDLFPQEK